MTGDPSLTSDPAGSSGRSQRVVPEEPLDAILSPELDKMVTDGEFKGSKADISMQHNVYMYGVFKAQLTDQWCVSGAILGKLYKIPGKTEHTHPTC